ncbi:hypothetical protein HXX76_010449 [Chlamydomonas incerta]|uniref:SRCR domain-containing protein n=1 Tax=Chlamydomonas incerta TaxID=51695 RepID=A0A835SYM2_CHLIN|nr:hypothetical protein HXX76_010449 [Chlamydomonas incerta]|eukprot:KAG2428301.1 hypothetical protein HXX76_010449 [Chlamydomonas incerta]
MQLSCDYYHRRLTDCDVFVHKGASLLDGSLGVDYIGVKCYESPPPPASGVVVLENEGALRLVGSPEAVQWGRGTVQLYHNAEWSLIYDSGWSRDVAHGVCVNFGYSTGIPVMDSGSVYGALPGPILTAVTDYTLACNSWRHNFSVCLDEYLGALQERLKYTPTFFIYPDNQDHTFAGVECYNDVPGREGDLRLRGGSANAGTLEVFHDGAWY